MFKNICYWFYLFIVPILFAQQPASIHLTEKDGLPDIEFYNITEDSKNYIWLAANKGLYIYNGRHFDYYSHPKQKGNSVFGVKEDNKGNIWCNNISGQFFYAEGNTLKLFIDLSDKLNGELTEFIITENELIVLPGLNIIRVDLQTKQVKMDFNKNVFIGAVRKYEDGYIYTQDDFIIKTNAAFKAIDRLEIPVFNLHVKPISIQNRVNITANDTINLCHFMRKGSNEFYDFNFKTHSYKRISFPNELKNRKINHSFFLNEYIWFSTDTGIFICKLDKGHLLLYNIYFKDKFVTKIIEDSDANFWAITKGDGIYVIPNINICKYSSNETNLNINKLEKLKPNTFVFGTTEGKVGLFNSETTNITFLDAAASSRVSEIKMFQNSDKTLIIKENSVHEITNNALQYKPIGAYNIRGAKSISKINDTAYVISTYKDARLLNDNFVLNTKLLNKRSYANHYSFFNQQIYITSVEGLFAFNSNLKKQVILHKNNPIYAKNIIETTDGFIWVTTFKDGILGIQKNIVKQHFTTKNGLLSNRISTITNDGDHLWIATDEGIQYLNTKNAVFKNLTKQNGIPTYRISDIEVEGDKAFFATNTGIFSVDKNKAFKDTRIPQVFISDISIGLKSVALKDTYDLGYKENSIKISFNANGFNSFLTNRYQFRLRGESDTWQTAESGSNSVSYYSLPSGNYTFEVKSVLADENSDAYIDTVSFKIAKPIWRQWWFYLGLLLIVGTIIYSFFNRKIRALKKKQAEILQKEQINKQLVLSQLENLRSQMNPHFIFNALNSIQEYIVFNEKELASSYLIKFSRLIRIYLEHSRESQVLLSEEIKALNIYLELEKNRFEDVLNYSIEVSKDVNTKRIKIPSLFIQLYVENALKHGLLHKTDNRKLTIIFTVNSSNTLLFCKIQDNGIGIEASRALNKVRNPMHKSFATTANQRRVNLLNTTRNHKIEVKTNSTSEGTEVLITIPI